MRSQVPVDKSAYPLEIYTEYETTASPKENKIIFLSRIMGVRSELDAIRPTVWF